MKNGLCILWKGDFWVIFILGFQYWNGPLYTVFSSHFYLRRSRQVYKSSASSLFLILLLSFCSEYSDCTMLHVSANNFASVWMNNQLWWIKSWFPIKNDDSWILIHDKRISDCTMLYGSANNFTSVRLNHHIWWINFPLTKTQTPPQVQLGPNLVSP